MQCDNLEFKMLYLQNNRRHGTGNLKKDIFLGHLQPPLDKNLEDLVILILEFDVNVKTIYCFLSSLNWDPEESPAGGPGFVPSMLKTY